MLEKIHFDKKVSKEDFVSESESFQRDFALLEQEIKKAKLPVIIIFEGWGASGKGTAISKLIRFFDPRGFKVYSNAVAEDFEKRRPLLWRFWEEIPERGKIAIMDRSWYQEIYNDRVDDAISEAELMRRVGSIKTFERQLTDDGYLILKFFLHISQKEQKKRINKLIKDENTAWRVSDKDHRQNKEYKKYFRVFDDMIVGTDTQNAPWHVLPSEDKYTLRLELFRIVRSSINDALRARENAQAVPPSEIIIPNTVKLVHMPLLSEIELHNKLEGDDYKKQLDYYKKKLYELHNEAYLKKVPVIMCYEGWDAAGKGGNIKRVTSAMDPRGYEVAPIASPTPEELNHQYLWRFWKKLPKTGHTVIFDRTWYGRVMVERLEGFCSEAEWKRAYQEINEFERELYEWGAVICKFWLQIDKDEQLRRFTDRQNTPEKQWKITDEDWRNRDKWDLYEGAVNEMFKYTSTDYAPWHIIESQDKKYGRVQALRIITDALEERLSGIK